MITTDDVQPLGYLDMQTYVAMTHDCHVVGVDISEKMIT